jgi:hypothetical protein
MERSALLSNTIRPLSQSRYLLESMIYGFEFIDTLPRFLHLMQSALA